MDLEKMNDLGDEIHDFIQDHAELTASVHEPNTTVSNWSAITNTGTELWLDTGDINEAQDLWSPNFTALTTNNSLLNQEVQTGRYDDLIKDTYDLLTDYNLDENEIILEVSFVLNAVHGLRLVDHFDASVSVEEHTELAHDVKRTIHYARRYHRIHPDKFVVKIPFTPAGLIATAILSEENIPVNLTVGFSARQNYLAAHFANPAYVNVFMGRLNSFVSDNQLGEGNFIGQKTALSSDSIVKSIRAENGSESPLQIAASFRNADQIIDTAGVDVMTIPPDVARNYLEGNKKYGSIQSDDPEDISPEFYDSNLAESIGINKLWEVSDRFKSAVDQLKEHEPQSMSPDKLRSIFQEHDREGFLPDWSNEQVLKSYDEGKIPVLETWESELRSGHIAVDSLMNLAGLNAFHSDQVEMDNRIRSLLWGEYKRTSS